MRTKSIVASAIALSMALATVPAFANSQESTGLDNAAADTQIAPQPTLNEDLVYLRDMLAVQTLRMDEAEQLLERQDELIRKQDEQIQLLKSALSASRGVVSAPVATGEYVVRRGDTMNGIARRFKVPLSTLLRLNRLSNPNQLRVGQRITIGEQPKVQVAAAAPAPAPTQTASSTQTAKPKTKPSAEPKKVAAAAPKTQEKPKPAAVKTAAATTTASDLPVEVGQRPEEEDKGPYLPLFSDVGGILTPRGTLFVEPEFSFTATSDNRFFFDGTAILGAVLVGIIEAEDSDRTSIGGSLGFRYGITSRLEVDGRITSIYRDDRSSGVVTSDNDEDSQFLRETTSGGFGDVSLGLHYQLNQGRKFPYTILNVRAQAPTGRGPFDVLRDNNGIEQQLSTGSGYWTVEPSLTFIVPSAPGSIFANIGYQANLPTSPDVLIGEENRIQEFDPGDAIRTTVGAGLSINDKFSLSFGYDQSYFLESVTESLQDGQLIIGRQPAATVGSFSFGSSYAISNGLRLNVNAAFGATDEAPDTRLSIRLQKKVFD